MKTKVIFKVIETKNGEFKVNQAANGYWWYHDTVYPSFEAAVAEFEGRSCDSYEFVNDQDYVPHYMR